MEPGPFSFASEERVRGILTAAGFAEVAMQPQNISLDIAAGGGLEAGVDTALSVGPAARALQDQPREVIEAARVSVREVLAPLVKGDGILLPASFWIVTARAP